MVRTGAALGLGCTLVLAIQSRNTGGDYTVIETVLSDQKCVKCSLSSISNAMDIVLC